LHIDR